MCTGILTLRIYKKQVRRKYYAYETLKITCHVFQSLPRCVTCSYVSVITWFMVLMDSFESTTRTWWHNNMCGVCVVNGGWSGYNVLASITWCMFLLSSGGINDSVWIWRYDVKPLKHVNVQNSYARHKILSRNVSGHTWTDGNRGTEFRENDVRWNTNALVV